jgi:putative transposase
MPRTNRHCLPGYVWYLTHHCHHKAFLLKFARDWSRYLRWLFEAKKRFGLPVLNYMVTSNHVHLFRIPEFRGHNTKFLLTLKQR